MSNFVSRFWFQRGDQEKSLGVEATKGDGDAQEETELEEGAIGMMVRTLVYSPPCAR